MERTALEKSVAIRMVERMNAVPVRFDQPL